MVYRYTVKWCYDIEVNVNEGIGAAESFCEAMRNIVDRFGENDLCDVCIEWLEDGMEIDFDVLLGTLNSNKQEQGFEMGPQLIAALEDLVNENEESKE